MRGEKFLVKSLEELEELAERVAKEVRAGDLLLLEGELGSGKTAFVKLLAKALGFEGEVTSPSFTVVNEYAATSSPSINKIVHVDLYRLEENEVAEEGAVRDVLERVGEERRLTVIEWSDRFRNVNLKDAWRLRFQHGPAGGGVNETETERVVTVEEWPKR